MGIKFSFFVTVGMWSLLEPLWPLFTKKQAFVGMAKIGALLSG